MAQAQVDLLIHAKWVLPIEPEDMVLENYSIAVRDGVIVGVQPTKQAERFFAAKEVRDLRDNHVVMPGFVNAHTHTPMTLLRSFVDNVELMDWLQNYIWPAEGKVCVFRSIVHVGRTHHVLSFV